MEKYSCVQVESGLFRYVIPFYYEKAFTSACKEMQRRGLRVVVPNQEQEFWCIHCPKEKPLAAEYKGYQKIFVKEYGQELHPEV